MENDTQPQIHVAKNQFLLGKKQTKLQQSRGSLCIAVRLNIIVCAHEAQTIIIIKTKPKQNNHQHNHNHKHKHNKHNHKHT